MTRTNLMLGQKTDFKSFSYYQEYNHSNPVSYIYPKDLNGDGVDEILFVAFETQPNTPENYTNTSVHIFGWINNNLQEITNTWLPNNTHLVEGVGDVAFGDFNGDGLVDAFLSGYTDMDHPVNAYVLYNQGGSFLRESMGEETWQHSVRSYDINNDGYDDVIPVGYADTPRYLGSRTGLVKYQGFTGGSGLAIGDFLADGSASVVFVDAGSGLNDTFLYQFEINDDQKIASVELISQLPGPRLESQSPALSSHDIRAIPFDFNDDGLLDVIVVSYGYLAQISEGERRSEIQFLQNKGQGNFEDVTEERLIGFDGTGYLGYYPQLVDVNADGRLDIFLSSPDWLDSYNSTTLLLQTENGLFVDTARDLLIKSINGGQGAIVKGPNNQQYLLEESAWDWGRALTQINLRKINFSYIDDGEILKGTSQSENIYGYGGNDFIQGNGGIDYIDGGDGIDVASYASVQSSITKTSNGYSINGDTLINVERIQFTDANIALDTEGATSAGGIYRLYQATFARTPDKEGYGFWLAAADNGLSAKRMAEDFTMSAEFQNLYGVNTTDPYFTGEDVGAMITGFYNNILGRDPDPSGYDFWVGVVENKIDTVGGVLTGFSESEENYNNTIGTIQNGMQYDLWAG